MDEAYLGTILMWAGNYPPMYWMYCRGQELQISQYQALFAVLGTKYGGDGVRTFKLPDLQMRFPIGVSALSGQILNNGNVGGANAVNLTANHLPSFPATFDKSPFVLQATTQVATTDIPSAKTFLASSDPDGMGTKIYNDQGEASTSLVDLPMTKSNTVQIKPTLAQVAVPTMPSYIALDFIICVQGLYPTPQ